MQNINQRHLKFPPNPCLLLLENCVGYLGVDDLVAGETGFAVLRLPTLETVRHPLHPNILMASQREVTDPAAEVLEMPEPVLGRGELRREDELVTGRTPGDLHLGRKVSAAVEMSLTVIVEQILQDLPALPARETVRVPAGVLARPLGKDGHLAGLHLVSTTSTPPAPLSQVLRSTRRELQLENLGSVSYTGLEPPDSIKEQRERGLQTEAFPDDWQQLHRRRHHWGRRGGATTQLGQDSLAGHVPLDVVHVGAHPVMVALQDTGIHTMGTLYCIFFPNTDLQKRQNTPGNI